MIAASTYVHRRKPVTRGSRLILSLAALAIFVTAVGTVLATPAHAAQPCTRFVASNFVGPLPGGTCRLVKSRLYYGKWSPVWGKPLNINFGNRDSRRIGEANRRNFKEVVLAVCGAIAVESGPVAAACVAGVVVYAYLLGDTFDQASANGQCVHVDWAGAIPRHYWAYNCG